MPVLIDWSERVYVLASKVLGLCLVSNTLQGLQSLWGHGGIVHTKYYWNFHFSLLTLLKFDTVREVLLMSCSCHFEIGVECQIFVIVIFF